MTYVRLGVWAIYDKLRRLDVRHSALLQVLKDYAQPNKKIHDMLKSGELLPLTKGFYLLSPQKLNQPYEPGAIANLLYGPSYVSMEWALSFYGLIPEKAVTVTSVTTKRPKIFETPIGPFTYDHLIQKKYVAGIRQIQAEHSKTRFLMASPAKALMDYLTFRVDAGTFEKTGDVSDFLENDLRLDLERFKELQPLEDLLVLKKIYSRNRDHLKVMQFLLKELHE
jgi:hypothetical protein